MDAGLGIGPGAIGMTGYDQYASQNQLDRSAATKTGHRDATALAHLSHTLYIPRHDDGAAHLAIRDISSQYAAAAGNLAIGSSQYVVTLGLMPKPRSDATDSASFPVSSILTNEDKAAILTTPCGTSTTEIPLKVTYPLPPSITRDGTFKHPYFSFQISDDPSTFEWQIHPSQQGRMRYTLVRLAASDQQQQQVGDSDIQAIYYHIGVGASLSLSYSEGVLLLPAGQDSVRESLVVASALGMLRRLRELHEVIDKTGKGSKKKSRLGVMKGLFGKKE